MSTMRNGFEFIKELMVLPGFGYHFNALRDGVDSSELNRAFMKIFESNTSFSPLNAIATLFPSLRWLVSGFSSSVVDSTF